MGLTTSEIHIKDTQVNLSNVSCIGAGKIFKLFREMNILRNVFFENKFKGTKNTIGFDIQTSYTGQNSSSSLSNIDHVISLYLRTPCTNLSISSTGVPCPPGPQ
jgi:hypothetical protein